jgi:hypothetical protein
MAEWTAGRTHTIAAVVVLVLAGLLVRDVRQQAPVTIDEPGWISSGAVTFDLVRRQAPVSDWEQAYDRLHLGDWGNQNPPVAKFYFGAVLALTGHGDPVAYRWAFPRSAAQNLAAGTLPPLAVVTPVRLGVVLTAAAVLWLSYLLAFALVEHLAAVLAPLVLFALPVFRFHATHVYTDVPELACVLLGAVLGCAYARRPRWATLIGAGLAGGLACAIKFNAAPIVAAAVLIVWWYSTRQRIARAVAVAAMPLILFVAVNPYLYPAPIARTRAIISTWNARKLQQQHDPNLAASVVQSRAEALQLVLRRGIVQPHVTPPFSRSEPLEWVLVPLLAAGLLVLLRKNPLRVAWATLFLTHVAMTVWWLPLDWARYYLPVAIWIAPLVSVAVAEAARLVRHMASAVPPANRLAPTG